MPFFGVRKVREDFYGAMHTFPMVVVTFRVLHCAAFYTRLQCLLLQLWVDKHRPVTLDAMTFHADLNDALGKMVRRQCDAFCDDAI